LDAAARRLAQRGPGVTLEEIADEAGVSRQTLYLHFGSRTGLLIAMVQHMDNQETLPPLVQQVFEAPTALEALDAAVTLHAEYHPVIYPVAKVFLWSMHNDAAIRAAWEERMESRRKLYHEVVEWLDREGQLAPHWDIETATDLLWSLTSWQVWEQLVVDRGWSKEDYVDHLRSVLRRTLLRNET
jgi:AcrR family transcriptional regulator